MTENRSFSWVVTEGHAGMENQCIGLAEAVGLPFEVKRARFRTPWRWLAPRVPGDPFGKLDAGSSAFAPPWPRLLIACGRQSIAISRAIKHASGGATFTVQTQHPRVDLKNFDLVVPPLHDDLTGANVFPILGAPHRVSAARLAQAKEQWRARYEKLRSPRVAVLIGGTSKSHRLTLERAREIGAQLAALAENGASLMLTMSRRTGEENAAAIRAALAGSTADIWDGEGDNPYFGMLAWADAILVTADSVNMMTEAAATGVPVHVLALPGGSPKFDRFVASLTERGIARLFAGRLESWRYEPLAETARAASRIRDLARL